jgi:type IV pilus assembly protein PilE
MPIALHTALPRSARTPSASRASRHGSHGSHGFTLIELMIAVAIVAILVGVALPSYREYVIRGHLADSSNGLALMRAQMERHYQDNRTYATAGTFTTPCASTDAAPRTFNNFVVTCSGTPTATTFTLAATGSGPAAGFAFTINQSDVRATTSAPTGWNTCTTKWLTKKGAAC